MKAVLMNSADKIQGILGMERTVLKQNGVDTWADSDAATDDEIPLDEEMGAGHLNAKRAYQQFDPGEYDAGGTAVPAVGWDYGFTDGFGDIQKYALAQALPMNQYVSITAAWDREVFFEIDDGTPGAFDVGDEFLNNAEPIDLNLYLMPAGATDLEMAVAQSIADDTSVEHIFHQVQTAGMYEIWVEQASGSDFATQPYALAWMTATPSDLIVGDYDGNGSVGPEDYDIWKANFGTSFAAADGNGNGVVDAADYTVWRDNLTMGSGSVAAVPEPSALWLALASLTLCVSRRSNVFTAARAFGS